MFDLLDAIYKQKYDTVLPRCGAVLWEAKQSGYVVSRDNKLMLTQTGFRFWQRNARPALRQPRTLTLEETLDGAERAAKRVADRPDWKKHL